MLVIADTSPLNYLILIDAIELLPRLYQRVILPRAAWQELQHISTPPAVAQWAQMLPDWIEIREAPEPTDPALAVLGSGEKQALAIAELYQHKEEVLLLLDEQAARQQAARRKLAATGTLGVLKAAAVQRLVDLATVFGRLRQTNFRVKATLLQQMLDEETERKQHAE